MRHIRNPNPESRTKSEIRDPKLEPPGLFGLRLSDFLRVSASGLQACSSALSRRRSWVSCGQSPEAPVVKPGSGKQVIAVIPMGATHNYWKSIHAGALQAAGELGNLEILWKSGLKEDDRDSQIKVVEDMITAEVNGHRARAAGRLRALRPPVEDGRPQRHPGRSSSTPDLKSRQTVQLHRHGQLPGRKRRPASCWRNCSQGKGRVAMLRNNEGSASTMAARAGLPGRDQANPPAMRGRQRQPAWRRDHRDRLQGQREPARAVPQAPTARLGLDGIFACNESTTFRACCVRCRTPSGPARSRSSASTARRCWSRRWRTGQMQRLDPPEPAEDVATSASRPWLPTCAARKSNAAWTPGRPRRRRRT